MAFGNLDEWWAKKSFSWPKKPALPSGTKNFFAKVGNFLFPSSPLQTYKEIDQNNTHLEVIPAPMPERVLNVILCGAVPPTFAQAVLNWSSHGDGYTYLLKNLGEIDTANMAMMGTGVLFVTTANAHFIQYLTKAPAGDAEAPMVPAPDPATAGHEVLPKTQVSNKTKFLVIAYTTGQVAIIGLTAGTYALANRFAAQEEYGAGGACRDAVRHAAETGGDPTQAGNDCFDNLNKTALESSAGFVVAYVTVVSGAALAALKQKIAPAVDGAEAPGLPRRAVNYAGNVVKHSLAGRGVRAAGRGLYACLPERCKGGAERAAAPTADGFNVHTAIQDLTRLHRSDSGTWDPDWSEAKVAEVAGQQKAAFIAGQSR